MEFLTLVLKTEGNGNQVWIKGVKETLEYYGWDKHYDVWLPKGLREGRRVSFSNRFGRKFGSYGGQSLRVSRSASKQGHEAGKTNVIRIHSHVTNKDLAELVALAAHPISWMENKVYRRVPHDEWMAIYLGVPAGRLPSFA